MNILMYFCRISLWTQFNPVKQVWFSYLLIHFLQTYSILQPGFLWKVNINQWDNIADPCRGMRQRDSGRRCASGHQPAVHFLWPMNRQHGSVAWRHGGMSSSNLRHVTVRGLHPWLTFLVTFLTISLLPPPHPPSPLCLSWRLRLA